MDPFMTPRDKITAVIAVIAVIIFWFFIIRALYRHHKRHLAKHPELVPTPEQKAAKRAAKKAQHQLNAKRLKNMQDIEGFIYDTVTDNQFADFRVLEVALRTLLPEHDIFVNPTGPREIQINSHHNFVCVLTIINYMGPCVAVNGSAINGAEDLVTFIEKDLT